MLNAANNFPIIPIIRAHNNHTSRPRQVTQNICKIRHCGIIIPPRLLQNNDEVSFIWIRQRIENSIFIAPHLTSRWCFAKNVRKITEMRAARNFAN